jgi:transcriptional regulator with XRE-family HTH domain
MPKALPPTFRLDGTLLRRHREEVLKQRREEVAVRAGCSLSQIAHIELEYYVPSVAKAARIVAAYGLRLDDVIVPVDEPEAATQ